LGIEILLDNSDIFIIQRNNKEELIIKESEEMLINKESLF